MNWTSISITESAIKAADRVLEWQDKPLSDKYNELKQGAKKGLGRSALIVTNPKGKIIVAKIAKGVFGCFIQDLRNPLAIVLTYLVNDDTLLRKLESGEWTI